MSLSQRFVPTATLFDFSISEFHYDPNFFLKLSLDEIHNQKEFWCISTTLINHFPSKTSRRHIVNFPLKCHFLEIFKMTLESSLIAYSIENFILKNLKTELFLKKLKCEEIWRHKKGHDVISSHKLVTWINVQF